MEMNLTTTTRTIRRHWLTVGFFLGFVTDVLLLNRVDDLFDNLVLLFYVLLSSVSLLLFYVGAAERGPAFLAHVFYKYAPLTMQYSFGGLLSGMLIFYGRSGDWFASAPFLLLILAVIFGNEFVDKRSDRLVYQLALYFIGLYSYVVLVLPVVVGKMGSWMFVASGLVALMLMTFMVQLLYRIIPHFMTLNTTRVIMAIGLIYVGFNTLYFTNLIPPIPLSLTELAVVQSVETVSESTPLKSYRVAYEVQPWYRQLPFVRPVLHPVADSIACFARVYAPTKLATSIYHRWEYKDNGGDWQEQSRIGYGIAGSNSNGYGGYTRISNFFPGVWRCSVETERGQVLGREVFLINGEGEAKGLREIVQ
jgi:hypothetical protein